MTAPVRVVVVGAGGMGRAWIGTVERSPAAVLVGVVDVVDGAAARAVEDLLPERAATVVTGTDLVAVAAAAGAEAVVDVTVPAAHHQVTADALHAGYAVLGEKPCAATLAEALSLAGHAETTGRLFMVSQSRRHNPHLREAARLAADLGGAGIVDTRFYRAPRFGGFREEMDHPLVVDMAIHAFDAGRVLLPGNPESVTAVGYDPEWSWYRGSASATVVIRYDSGAVHTFSGSWAAPGTPTSWNGEWHVVCRDGGVSWDGETPPVAVRGSAGFGGLEDAPVETGRTPADTDLWELASSLDEFCTALREGTVPTSEVHDNVWTQAVVEAAVLSADEGRTVAIVDVLDAALATAREADRADGRSDALSAWTGGAAGLRAG